MSHDHEHKCCSADKEYHHHHCCPDHHHHGDEQDHSNFAQELIALADEAWMEVLKEKIKEQVKNSCTGLDELAKIISDANNKRWCAKMQAKKECDNFHQKVLDHFYKGQ